MKKLVLFAVFAVALSGMTMAQTTPSKKEAKKEKMAPAPGSETKKDTTGHHHHQKHAKPKKG